MVDSGFYTSVSKTIAALLGKLSRWLSKSGEFAPKVSRSVAEDFSLEVPFYYVPESSLVSNPIAVICHIFHTELTDEMIGFLKNIQVPVKVFVSTDTAEKQATIYRSFANWGGSDVDVRIVPNCGRDIAPKFITFADVYERHDLLLFLHSKKSPHLSDGEKWRCYLMNTLIGSPNTVLSVLELFRRFPSLGMVIPQHYEGVRQMISWGSNFSSASALARRMNFLVKPASPLDLPSGSMFWARSQALRPILDLKLSLQEFHPEAGQVDGTTAHALERLLLYVCEKAGFDWIKIADRKSSIERNTIVSIQKPGDLAAFVERHIFRLMASELSGIAK